MTNAEKYLKDGVDVEELAKEFEKAIYKRTSENIKTVIKDYFDRTITLTEDERVILRNIKDGYKYIYKTTEGHLMLSNVPVGIRESYISTCNINQYKHLFQFIKERRRI